MLEAMLDYYPTPAWSVGARLWAWSLGNDGSIGLGFLGMPADNGIESEGQSAERCGVLVRSFYRWGAGRSRFIMPQSMAA